MMVRNLFCTIDAVAGAVAGVAMSVILFGCGSSDSGLPVMDLEADMSVENTQNPETVANFRIVVHPEVTDSTLIQYLNLVDIIDGRFYIASNNLMVFGNDGKCVSSFNHVGPGPEEYGQWDGALVDPASGDWIMTPSNMQPILKRYTQYGAFVEADTILPVGEVFPHVGEMFPDVDEALVSVWCDSLTVVRGDWRTTVKGQRPNVRG